MIGKWLNRVDRLNAENLILYIVAASILLASWMQYIQHGWINPDSVLYLEQGRLFLQGEWQAAFQVFRWPLYGFCIGLTAQLTSLSIHTSAQLLNMLFFGLATASFLKLIKLAGGKSRTLFLGALLLFSSQYIVGDVLEMLMRDEGFWAFYLTALVFFIRYMQDRKLSDALSWQACMIVATLFRIEAILFLILLPLTCLLSEPSSLKRNLKNLLQTYSISIVIAAVIAIVLLSQPQLSMSQFGRLDEVFSSNLYQKFTLNLFTKSEVMSQQVLGKYLDEFAIPGLLLTFLYVMGAKTISATGLIGTGLAIFGYKHSSIKIQSAKRVMIVVGIIALISMALIIIKVFVLSSRYVVSLAWMLLIFASFYLASLSLSSNKKTRITFIILCLILSLGFVKNILPKRDGYNYERIAVAWVKSTNTGNKQVYYDDSRLRYYANVPFQGTGNFWKALESDINDKSVLPYDYLILTIGKRDQDKIDTLSQKLSDYKEVKRFYSAGHKKYCAIYLKQS